MNKTMNGAAIAVVLLLGLLLGPQVLAASFVNKIYVGDHQQYTKVVIELSGPVSHNTLKLDKPHRLVVDLKNAQASSQFKKPRLFSASPVKNVRYAKRNGRDFRIVFDLKESISSRSALLKPDGKYGYRLVLDLKAKSSTSVSKPQPKRKNEKAQQDKAKQKEKVLSASLNSNKPKPASEPKVTTESIASSSSKRDIIIAIDPGHGGRDPGAIGPRKIQEKTVVLQISRLLAGYLKAEKGFKPVLIRTGDYFIELRNRTALARKHHADLLVSVHADAFKTSAASGASVYALSDRGASSETARWLAQRENQSDLIGGAGDVSLDDKDHILKSVLLDLSMTASLSASLDVGHSVLGELKHVSKLHRKRVEQAAFVVLKSPDIPSILVETGFISNPGEARRLQTKNHQRKVARAIFNGIRKHFLMNPPPGTLLAWQQNREPSLMVSYTIRRGDTISSIAAKNNISEQELRHINKLSGDRIRVGQVLQIPTS